MWRLATFGQAIACKEKAFRAIFQLSVAAPAAWGNFCGQHRRPKKIRRIAAESSLCRSVFRLWRTEAKKSVKISEICGSRVLFSTSTQVQLHYPAIFKNSKNS
jgi:hypothetical protein